MSLRPISLAPMDGTPILAYFEGREPLRQYCVLYYDEGAYLWRTAYGRDFVGHPTHFQPLEKF